MGHADQPDSRRTIVRIQRRLASVTAVSAVTLFGLTGCGGDLGPELHPGTAATVGDSSISISTVDDKSEQLCRFGVETGQLEGAVPMASVRSSYVQAYVRSEEHTSELQSLMR